MARQRHLKNAPITEALINFQVSDLEGFADRQEQLTKALSPAYYRKGDITLGTFQVALPPGAQLRENIRTEARQIGIRLHSDNEKYVAQATRGGLTLSRLPPYENWAALRDEMRRVWEIYANIFLPSSVNRVVVRYINSILIVGAAPVRLESIFTRPPMEPVGMPELLSSFLTRCVVEDPVSSASVVVTLASQAYTGDALPVILDIEAVRVAEFPVSEDPLWGYLEKLRDLKNAAFFGSLTEERVSQYD